MRAVAVRSAGGIVMLQHYLRWRDAGPRHPEVLAAPASGANRISAGPVWSRKALDQIGDRLSRS
jgi:hypothetical protein